MKRTSKSIYNLHPFLFKYPLDRVGQCHFVLSAQGRQLSHTIAFNTTEERKTSWRDSRFMRGCA